MRRFAHLIVIAAATLGAGRLCIGATAAETIALTHATLIDGTGAAPPGAVAIDASGKYAVPGIMRSIAAVYLGGNKFE